MRTTVGTLDPPLGNTRLQVARLISALVATNNPAVNQELANLGTLEVLLVRMIVIISVCTSLKGNYLIFSKCGCTVFQDLFFKYQWNNFLHTQVEQCIAAALRQQTKASGDGDPQMHCLVENVSISIVLLLNTSGLNHTFLTC